MTAYEAKAAATTKQLVKGAEDGADTAAAGDAGGDSEA